MDVSAEHVELVAMLLTELEGFRSRELRSEGSRELEFDEEAIGSLEALGYTGGH